MSRESLKEIMEKDIETEVKIIINTLNSNDIKLLLTRNIKGEIDFLIRHFTISRQEKSEKQIKNKVEQFVKQYIHPKKNDILKIELIRKNKGNLRRFVIDCLVNVKNDKTNPDKREEFMTLNDITRRPYQKSISLINTLFYFTEKQ